MDLHEGPKPSDLPTPEQIDDLFTKLNKINDSHQQSAGPNFPLYRLIEHHARNTGDHSACGITLDDSHKDTLTELTILDAPVAPPKEGETSWTKTHPMLDFWPTNGQTRALYVTKTYIGTQIPRIPFIKFRPPTISDLAAAESILAKYPVKRPR